MIQIHSNFITDSECEELIDYYKSNTDKIIRITSDNVYHFDGVNIIDIFDSFSFLKRINLRLIDIDRIRVQHVDNETNILEKYHTDTEPYSFIVFLNDNFVGGNLMFSNVEITPVKKQLVYSDGNELHYVKRVHSGDRFTLVCFLKKHIDFNKFKNMI